ncbi:MAG: heparin lyase I family protein [Woeseia sp.]
MVKQSVVALVFGALSAAAFANEKVLHTVSFESGRIQENSEFLDAGFIQTLPNPQIGDEAIKTGKGGCGPDSNCDMRVVRSEFVAGQTVKPRAGEYFLRMQLDKKKDYTGLNVGLSKPRTSLNFGNDVYRFDHDVEEWIGFSVFLPNDYEHETENVGLILSEITTDSSAQFLKLLVGSRNGDKESHWYFNYRTSNSSVTNGNETVVDLGSIEPDKGKWTDFVLRVRSNPFSVDTNPAASGIRNAKDRMYKGNKGIIQVWKAAGPVMDKMGNRKMVNKIDEVNKPVGLVPGATQGESKIAHSIRAYKPGWQGHNNASTSVVGPIWIAWDEVRFGEAARHGTGYEDVHPTGAACTDRCPEGSATPRPVVALPAAPGDVIGEVTQ